MRVLARESSYEDIPEADREREILDALASEPKLAGLIISPSSHARIAARTWNWIAKSPVPVVVLERDQPPLCDCFVDSVRTNHPYGVRKAAMHFLAKGHHRIGAALSSTPTAALIQKGWEHVVRDTDRIECPFVVDGIQPYDTAGVEQIVERTLATGVTGLLVHSDYLAVAIAQRLERQGRRVPQDVSLISIDGFATPSTRPLTVLRSSTEMMGNLAVSTLLERIAHPDAPTRHIFIDPTLIDRGSVADLLQLD